MEAETSYADQPLFGPRNLTPTHFWHIAAYREHQRQARIRARLAEARRNLVRGRFLAYP